jgi:hypothetical protein
MRTSKKPKTPPAPKQEPGSERPKRASSLKHAAGLLGLPAGLLRGAKAAGCPGFDDHNRVDLDRVEQWLASNKDLLEARGELLSKEQAEVKKILLQCERIEFQNEVLRQKYVEVKTLVPELEILASGQMTVLRQKLENEYPALASGKQPAEIRVMGKELVDLICGEMHKYVQQFKAALIASTQ